MPCLEPPDDNSFNDGHYTREYIKANIESKLANMGLTRQFAFFKAKSEIDSCNVVDDLRLLAKAYLVMYLSLQEAISQMNLHYEV